MEAWNLTLVLKPGEQVTKVSITNRIVFVREQVSPTPTCVVSFVGRFGKDVVYQERATIDHSPPLLIAVGHYLENRTPGTTVRGVGHERQ